jgi:hypothetical protein
MLSLLLSRLRVLLTFSDGSKSDGSRPRPQNERDGACNSSSAIGAPPLNESTQRIFCQERFDAILGTCLHIHMLQVSRFLELHRGNLVSLMMLCSSDCCRYAKSVNECMTFHVREQLARFGFLRAYNYLIFLLRARPNREECVVTALTMQIDSRTTAEVAKRYMIGISAYIVRSESEFRVGIGGGGVGVGVGRKRVTPPPPTFRLRH